MAVGLVIWGVLTLDDSRVPHAEEVEDTEVPEWILTGQGDAGVVAKKMPGQKMRGQQPPPCEPVHHAINDACWIRADYPAPCGDLYEHEGHCYVPVIEKKRSPTSVDD